MIRHDVFNRHQIIAPGVRSHGFMPTGEDQYAISFNGTTTYIHAGSDSSLDDLHDSTMTVEAWVNLDSKANSLYVVHKRGNPLSGGWALFYVASSTNKFGGWINCATTNAQANLNGTINTGTWYHVAMTWDDASYNYPRMWLDGTEGTAVATSRSGAVVSDASNILEIGHVEDGNQLYYPGDIAWIRISDTVRWTTTFTPDAKDSPPATDGNTVALWTMNEGTGTNVEDKSANTNDGTLSNGSWVAL